MRKRTKIIIAAVLIVLALIGYNSFTKKKPVNYTSAKVERGDVVQTVSATGAVEAASKVDLKFVSSEKIKEIDVKVGDTIKQGAILGRLDTAKLDSQLLQAQAALAVAQANYQTLLDGSSNEQVKLAETQVENAKTALSSAQQSLDDTNISTQKDIASAKVSLDNANQGLDNAKKSNESNLNNTYDSAWDSVSSSLASCEDALNTNKTVLENDDAKDTLSVMNLQYLSSAKLSRDAAENSYDAAISFRDSVSSNQSPSNVDAAITKAQGTLEKTITALSNTYSVLQSTVTSSKLSQTKLDGLKADISSSRTSINAAIASLTAKKQAISSQIVTNQTSLNNAEANVNSANSNLSAVQSSASSKINAAQNAIYSRQGDLNQAQDNLNQVKAGPSSSKVSAARAQIEQAQANVNLINNQISEYTLIAPQDGTVTALNGEVGEIVSLTEPFASMMVPNGFEIKTNIAEVDIAKIKSGDDVDITFDALGSDKHFTGKVSEIDPAETVISGVVYYNVTTLFTDGDNLIKSGMTANMDIMTAKSTNVLKVPFQAVKEKDGKKYVQVVAAKDKFNDTDINIGLKGDTDYEIVSGLNEGQDVVTFMGK
jgi:HlyD family secretion protein